jgi:hypothetical protein
MRHTGSRRAVWKGVLAAAVGLLVVAAPASATGRLGSFTEINTYRDGAGIGPGGGLCHNKWTSLLCNQFYNERFAWLTGGVTGNTLPDGTYFFAVLEPSLLPNPNDKSPVRTSDQNLSDDVDSYKNRTFTVKNGDVFGYTGNPGETPHDFGPDVDDGGEKKIRLMPHARMRNGGGVYVLAVCPLKTTYDRYKKTYTTVYPVSSHSCWYDAFKIWEDHKAPECPSPAFGANASGQKTARQLFMDPGGIDLIKIDKVTNATIAPLKPGENWYQGTTSWVELTATKIDQSRSSSIQIFVRDVAGNETRCDPVLTTLKGRVQRFRVTEHEDTVSIRNGGPGLRRIEIGVNGRRYIVRGLRPGKRVKLDIGSALRPGKDNRVTLRGIGRGNASIMIAN